MPTEQVLAPAAMVHDEAEGVSDPDIAKTLKAQELDAGTPSVL
jgi:hypothetical protein